MAVYAAMSTAMAGPALLTTLAGRPGWSRQSDREFVHAFGCRRFKIAIPPRFDARMVSTLVTRAEINTVLGDSEWSVLAELHALARCELQRLF